MFLQASLSWTRDLYFTVHLMQNDWRNFAAKKLWPQVTCLCRQHETQGSSVCTSALKVMPSLSPHRGEQGSCHPPANVKRPKFEKVKRKNRELASSANSWIFATEHQKVVRFWAFMLFTTSRNSAQQSRNGWIRSFKIQRSCWKGLHCYYKIKFRHWWPSHLFNIGWACLSCFPRQTSKSITKSRDLLPDPLKIHKGD